VAFHAVNRREPAIRTTTPTAIGTARASAGCCISIAASATPSQKKRGNSEHSPDEEVTVAHERGQPAQARLVSPADGLR
jgi:hypothetical protein